MEYYIINNVGLAEIHDFLGRSHKLGYDHFNADMIRAWAADAEFQLESGNGACIEVRSFDSASGHTENFTVSSAGIDTVDIDD